MILEKKRRNASIPKKECERIRILFEMKGLKKEVGYRLIMRSYFSTIEIRDTNLQKRFIKYSRKLKR